MNENECDPEDMTPVGRINTGLSHLEWLIEELQATPGGSRGRMLAMTKLQEAYYWLSVGYEEEKHKPQHEER